MGTNVKLYYTNRGENTEWELIPSKLLVVEDIASYLASKSNKALSDFQYIKNELELSINVDLSQEYAQPLTNSNFKYVSIQNAGENIHYYFVKKAIWRSKTCVRFDLVMDVLNTFEENKDYKFKANTRIIREHKDRFQQSNLVLSIEFGEGLYEGSLSTNDYVEFFFQVGGVEYTICKGNLTSIDSDEATIKVDDNYTKEHIEHRLSQGSDFYIRKDEHNWVQLSLFDYDISFSVFRKIDIVQENINPILQCDNAQGTKITHQKNKLNCDWYLLYRNQNNPTDSLVNPVECYIIPGEERQVLANDIVSGRLLPTTLTLGRYYVVCINTSYPYVLTLDDGTILSKDLLSANENNLWVIIYRNSNSEIVVQTMKFYLGSNITIKSYSTSYINLGVLPTSYRYKTTALGQIDSENDVSSYYSTGTSGSWSDTTTPNVLDSIAKLDRTDSKNIKLIKLPYVPYDFTITSNKIDVRYDTKWSYVALTQGVSPNESTLYVLKLNDLNTPLQCSLKSSQVSTFWYLYFSSSNYFNPSVNDLRKDISYESKLFHSEFWQPTFYYDSFAFKVQLEKCYLPFYYDYDDYAYVDIDFTMTKTINSKFMFSFTNYYLKNAEENYAKYLPIARNNEEVLYNVPYINYIRNGYQYDIKNKNIATISNSIGLGLSVASIGASLLAPSVPLKVAGVVGSLVSMAMSVKNTITSAIQTDNSIKQKMTQYQNQASSVAGSDDVDLMSVYAENRLKYLVYQPTDTMRNLLFDLFFYAGYSSNRMGIPTHNNRVNFDYLECEASIEALGSIPQECIDEIVGAMKNGITYLHKTTRTTKKWDFKQEYENWEVDML